MMSRDIPQTPVIICCHHKSGTNFLRGVLDGIRSTYNPSIWMKFYDSKPKDGWDFCFHQHGRVSDLLLGGDFRGLRSIRHPKSLILSAALYHEKCSEPWVDVPLESFGYATFAALSDRDTYNIIKDPLTDPSRRQELMHPNLGNEVGPKSFVSKFPFQGRTYRSILQSLPSIEEKCIFEMNCFSRGVIEDMVLFPFDQRFYTIHLEDISHERSMAELSKAFQHLGYRGNDHIACMEIAKKHCLWNNSALPRHSTTGVSDAWKDVFKDDVQDQYISIFGTAELALGYDPF